MKKLSLHFSLLFLILVAPLVDDELLAQSQPCTLFVSTCGSDANDGSTEATSFRTVQKAADSVQSGDVVCVGAGTYSGPGRRPGSNDPFIYFSGENGMAEAPITFRPLGDGPVVIDGSGYEYGMYVARDYYIIDGFEITATEGTGIALWSNNNQVLNNHIHHNADYSKPPTEPTGQGIFEAVETFGNLYRGNWIHENGLVGQDTNLDHGMYLTGRKGVVEDNIVYRNAAYGLHLYPSAQEYAVQRNQFYENGRAGIIVAGPGSQNNIIQNNLSYHNGKEGVLIWGGSSDNKIINNTFYDNGTYGAAVTNSDRNQFKNNIFSENTSGALVVNGPWGANVWDWNLTYPLAASQRGQNDIVNNPLFANPASGDFHLNSSSPAIDKGTPQDAPSTDFEGNPRPQGTSYDIGAYEYKSGLDDDVTPPTVPTDLTATVISSTQIDLSWTPSTDNVGVTGYIVYRNGKEIGTTTGTSYQSTGLKASTRYTYRVAAYDGAGNRSPKSMAVARTTQPAPSTKFTTADRVRTTKKANVRSAPSKSGTAVGTQRKAAVGTVVGGPWYWNQKWWWQVDFDDGTDGWAAQGKLKKVVP